MPEVNHFKRPHDPIYLLGLQTDLRDDAATLEELSKENAVPLTKEKVGFLSVADKFSRSKSYNRQKRQRARLGQWHISKARPLVEKQMYWLHSLKCSGRY